MLSPFLAAVLDDDVEGVGVVLDLLVRRDERRVRRDLAVHGGAELVVGDGGEAGAEEREGGPDGARGRGEEPARVAAADEDLGDE